MNTELGLLSFFLLNPVSIVFVGNVKNTRRCDCPLGQVFVFVKLLANVR